MSYLIVEDMSQGFADKELFHNVSFRLSKGEHIGLVGSNGQGKTTFFKIITGETLPDAGNITWSKRTKLGYMDQHVELDKYSTVKAVLYSAYDDLAEYEKQLNALYESMGELEGDELDKAFKESERMQKELDDSDFYSAESRIMGMAAGVGIRDLLEKNPKKLSGGQRTKVILAKLLLEKPDVLLLDEPTNHLDEENVAWLRDYLSSYDKAFILISHDTEFMNSVVNIIYHLENKILTRYVGDYNKFLKLYDEKNAQLVDQYNKQQTEIKKLETYIAKNKVRASTSAMAKSREKQLNKIDRIVIDKKLPTPHFKFKFSRESTKRVFETDNLIIGYDKPLTKPLNLELQKGDKVAVTGANGIGKTTLLKSLMSIINPLDGNIKFGENIDIGYYEQEVNIDSDKMPIDVIWDEFPKTSVTDIRKMLARCGLTSKHIDTPVNRLSGGEQAKIRLCKVMNHKCNLLYLDEPTNHLDVNSKAALKQAIESFEGTVILVCHEPEFYGDIATKVWDFQKLKHNL